MARSCVIISRPLLIASVGLDCGAGAKLKQQAALVAAPAPALDVLEDKELAEAPAADPAPAPAGTLRRRLDGGALQEGLLHDPLRLHKVRLWHITSRVPIAGSRAVKVTSAKAADSFHFVSVQ